MKSQKRKKLKISLLVASMLFLVAAVFAVMTSASENIEVVGEMVDIKAEFSEYCIQDTVRMSDEYVGSYQYTIYYDKAKGEIKTSYHGTPVIIYTINHPAIERVGTDSNEKIINSMLDSGYIVVVLDFLNNYNAKGTDLEKSVQQFRRNFAFEYSKMVTNKDALPKGI